MIVGQIRIAPVVSEDVFDLSAAALAFRSYANDVAGRRLLRRGRRRRGGMEYEEGFKEGFLRENMVSERAEVDTAVRSPVKMMTAEKVFP